MSNISTVAQRLNPLRLANEALLGVSVAIAGLALSAGRSLAADVTAPIKQVEDARAAAKDTTLDAAGAKGSAETIADILIVWAAPIGLGIALFGFWLLHKANQDESGRASKGAALGTIILGGFTAVFSVLTFVVVEYVLGTKT